MNSCVSRYCKNNENEHTPSKLGNFTVILSQFITFLVTLQKLMFILLSINLSKEIGALTNWTHDIPKDGGLRTGFVVIRFCQINMVVGPV
jgi:hypothetical protein